MKILSIAGTFSQNKGTPIRVRKIIHYLASRKDIELFVFTKETIPTAPFKILEMNNSLFKNFFFLKDFIKKNRPDIVLCHTIGTVKYLFFLKMFSKTKIVLENHGFIEKEGLLEGSISRLRYYRNKWIYTLAYRMCDLIITSSQSATEILSKYNKNVITIYGGVDLNIFNPNIKPKTDIKIDKDKLLIGYAGNDRVWQGLDFLEDLFVKDLDKNKYRLLVLTSAERNKKNKGVEYFQPVDHSKVSRFLSSCDVLVIPRLDNIVNKISFPSKLLEYIAMGKPVIASRTSDMFRVITHQENGLLFDPGNKKAFVDLLEMLFLDQSLRKKLGQKAYKTSKGFTWDIQLFIMVRALEDLINK